MLENIIDYCSAKVPSITSLVHTGALFMPSLLVEYLCDCMFKDVVVVVVGYSKKLKAKIN